MSANHIYLGRLGKPHGVRGEVRLFPDDPDSDSLEAVSEVWVERSEGRTQRFELESARPSTRYWIVRLAGVRTREDSERLKGAACYVDRDALPELDDEDAFYVSDLMGLEVVSQEGDSLGSVLDIFDNGAHDVLVYGTTAKKSEMVPFIEEYVLDIDLDQGIVTIEPLQY